MRRPVRVERSSRQSLPQISEVTQLRPRRINQPSVCAWHAMAHTSVPIIVRSIEALASRSKSATFANMPDETKWPRMHPMPANLVFI
jgi:hypothetical protein